MHRHMMALILMVSAGVCAAQTSRPARRTLRGASVACPPSGKVTDELDLASAPGTLDSLILGSNLIVEGTIAKVLPAFNRDPNISSAIETDSLISVSQTLLGTLPGTTDITLAQIGGKTDACEEIVPEDPPVKAGEQYILFLTKDDRTSVPNPSGFQRYFALGLWNGRAKMESGKIQFLPAAEKGLHKLDNTSATDLVSSIQQRIPLLGLTVSGKPKR